MVRKGSISRVTLDLRDREGEPPHPRTNIRSYVGGANGAPKTARQSIADLVGELLAVFYVTGEEDTGHALVPLWKLASPYLRNHNSGTSLREMQEEHFLTMIPLLREKRSLPVQIEAVAAATEHDKVTLRRLLILAVALIRQTGRHIEAYDEASVEEMMRPALLHLGPLVLPVLLAVTREDWVRPKLINVLLTGLKESRKPEFFAEILLQISEFNKTN